MSNTICVYDGFERWISRDPLDNAEMKLGPNLYEYVGNDPVLLTDPLGLWQFTAFGGNGVMGAYVTFGHSPSTGQWNMGMGVGWGAGASGGLDMSDSGCKQAGFLGVAAASAGNGAGGANGELNLNSGGGSSVTAGGRLGYVSGSSTAQLNGSGPSTNTFGYGGSNYGAAVFVGGGVLQTW